MAFTMTDEHLQRLKEATTGSIMPRMTTEAMKALLERLEAAEWYGKAMAQKHPGWFTKKLDAWRKAAGKGPDDA